MLRLDKTALVGLKQIVKAIEEEGKFKVNGKIEVNWIRFFRHLSPRALKIMSDLDPKTLNSDRRIS